MDLGNPDNLTLSNGSMSIAVRTIDFGSDVDERLPRRRGKLKTRRMPETLEEEDDNKPTDLVIYIRIDISGVDYPFCVVEVVISPTNLLPRRKINNKNV